MTKQVQCGGCGRKFNELPSYGACEDCQNQLMLEQEYEEQEQQRWDDYHRKEREAGRL